MRLARLKAGDALMDFAGPLGNPTELEGAKRACVIGGGLGTAIAFPQAKWLHDHGCEVDVITGFRTRTWSFWRTRSTRTPRARSS